MENAPIKRGPGRPRLPEHLKKQPKSGAQRRAEERERLEQAQAAVKTLGVAVGVVTESGDAAIIARVREQVGPRPTDPIEQLRWCSELAGAATDAAAFAIPQSPALWKWAKAIAEQVRSLGMTAVKAKYEADLAALHKRVRRQVADDADDGTEPIPSEVGRRDRGGHARIVSLHRPVLDPPTEEADGEVAGDLAGGRR